MAVTLLIVSVVIFGCVLLNRLSGKLGIPMLLAFILLGMFFGSDGAVRIAFDDYALAEKICSVALIFIMFYGGFGTNWREARPVAAKAIVLSSLGVVLTSLLVGVFCRLALGIGWLESFLVGSVIGSTDAASVFSILRSRRLNLRDNTASLLEVESGSNDPFAYMLTAIFIALMNGGMSGGAMAYLIFSQLVYGVALGFVIALLAAWLLKRVRFHSPGFDAAFVIGLALLSYAGPAALGGNGYLSAYIVGIVLGNADIRNKNTLVPFFDGITGLMQMLIFFLLGLLAFPSRLPHVALPALLIALFLTLVARPAAVFALMTPFGSSVKQSLLVSWAGLRGAASIVFAVMAVMAVKTENDIFHIVFCIVLFSILLQGSLLPFVSRKLRMIDETADVMRTFSDYAADTPAQFIEFVVPQGHPWHDQLVRDVVLPPDTLLALLIRDGEEIVPRGSTLLMSGDLVILCAKSPAQADSVPLTEQRVSKGDAMDGKRLGDLPRERGPLVILIVRGDDVVIPRGDTVLAAGDVLVLHDREATPFLRKLAEKR